MSRTLLTLSLSASLMGSAALADVPNVAADVAPIHSLVARVMEGVGTPDLIVQSGASPHEYSLRPSEAAALQNANLVFWVGPDLTPWLEGAIETIATGAVVTELMEAEGTIELPFREGALFEAHSHGDGDHDAHGDEDHDDHEGHHHDEHGNEDHDDHAGHHHGAHDPHVWLSPDNAAAWLNVIAAQLSAADPDNAGTYFANAASARSEIVTLTEEVNATLDPVRGGNFIVFHDAYQYFETTFDFPASGAISLSDASDPSPARIAEIQHRIATEGVDCVLAEPQFNMGLIETVLDGTTANTGIMDPLGSDLELGSDLYPQLIRNLAETLADCL
ncbi:zinc ABC transporter substrate-binding protein [Gymnodinialimonas sp. 57CJ19]|uniref:zinc ABC transporter substrate-binding protein n=1 Tax=Gymnodinialimonas sp. 57CJ19 TaxID=3138498 RepID=UPI0031345DDA